jgi:hypothetical protein
MPLRSDQYPEDVKFIDPAADTLGLEELNTPNWQVVFGRRGTGKTRLLRSFSEMIKASFSTSRNWAIYLSASDFTVSDQNVSDATRAHAYFQIFLDSLTLNILDAVDKFLGDPNFMNFITGDRRNTIDKMQNLALEPRELVNDGSVIPALTKMAEHLKWSHNHGREVRLRRPLRNSVDSRRCS